MYDVVFTRLTGTEQVVVMMGSFETYEEAHKTMAEDYKLRITEGRFDPEWSYIDEFQSFCATEDMYDTIRTYILDTEVPYDGFLNDNGKETVPELDLMADEA